MGCTQRQRQWEWEGKGVPSNSSRRSLRKGLWSPDEDIKLTTYIMRKGLMGCWNYIAEQAGLQRCGKSCRLRWINYLRPGLKRCAISPQEERLIIQLQSSLGNRFPLLSILSTLVFPFFDVQTILFRSAHHISFPSRSLDYVCTTMMTRWSQIAAHLPGRTDNEVKNYWNSAIKKKLMLKHHRPSSSTVAIEKGKRKPNFVFQSDRIRDEDSVSAHVPEVVTLSHSALPDLEVMPVEGYQRNNSTFNILFSTGENQGCARDVLELKQKAEDTNDEFLINPDPIHTAFISRYLQAENPHDYKAARQSTCDELILNSRRTIIPPHEVPSSAIKYLLDSAGFSIPALSEIQSSKENIENDGQIIEKDTMIDYSSLTESRRISAWNAAYSNSNIGGDITEVYSGVSYYTNELLGTGVLEDVVTAHHEKTASQSWQPPNLVAQVCAPLIRGTSNLYAENELMDRPNLSYDVPTYAGMSSSWQNSYKIEGGGIGDQQNCSRFPNEKPNTKPILPIFGGESGASEIDEYYEGGAGQVPVSAQDDMCNINTCASDPHQIYIC